MNIHKNARTFPHSRLLTIRRVRGEKQPIGHVAASFEVSRRTVSKWLRRWRTQGEAGLQDRSSRPLRSPHRLTPDRVAQIERLRR